MGDVLSPDRAKILINTVVVAINASAKGVRLAGYAARDGVRAWREILCLMYADDAAHTMPNVTQLRRVWAVWSAWSSAVGSLLGFKGVEKTVVSGVRWVDGKVFAVGNPCLPKSGGGLVPFLTHAEAYKHLGRLVRLDGDDGPARARLRDLLARAVSRLRRVG